MLSDEDEAKLAVVEQEFIESLKTMALEICVHQVHWHVRDELHKYKVNARDAPEATWLYFEADWMDPSLAIHSFGTMPGGQSKGLCL